ncbi:MAG: N-acetyltransferase [Alphaproteobacteria bacterium]|nr:N-acetyltransferase [Alphaproteobacteria bacterium]
MSDAASFRFMLCDSAPGDDENIAAIYAHHVRVGLGTFKEVPPPAEEMRRRREAVLALGLPFMVAVAVGRVVGYAYAALYRMRSAYRFTVEDSIYIAPDFARRGIGRALLTRLIERCSALGYRQMVAVIGDSANTASIRLHETAGFAPIGVQPAVGFKHGRWVDCVLMQRTLGAGAATLPKVAADESEEAFEAKLKKIAKAKPQSSPKAKE